MIETHGKLKRHWVGIGMVLAFGLVSSATGCTKTDERPVDTTGIAPAAADTARDTVNTGMIGRPGDNRQATLDYFKNVVRFDANLPSDSSFTAEYDCHGQCGGPSALPLYVTPERNARNVNWRTALQNSERRGYIVAKLENRTERRFGPLNLPAGGTIYQWVGPVSATGSRHRVAWIQIDTLTGAAIGQFEKPSRKIKTCTLANWENRSESAVRRLPDHHPVGTQCSTLTISLQAGERESDSLSLAPFYPPGMWNSCAGGCCEAQGGT